MLAIKKSLLEEESEFTSIPIYDNNTNFDPLSEKLYDCAQSSVSHVVRIKPMPIFRTGDWSAYVNGSLGHNGTYPIFQYFAISYAKKPKKLSHLKWLKIDGYQFGGKDIYYCFSNKKNALSLLHASTITLAQLKNGGMDNQSAKRIKFDGTVFGPPLWRMIAKKQALEAKSIPKKKEFNNPLLIDKQHKKNVHEMKKKVTS